jgi:hypothetical protein
MAEREVVSVAWYERDDLICVTYIDDEPDRMTAAQSVAADFARETGLRPVATSDGICRWVRDPGVHEETADPEASR